MDDTQAHEQIQTPGWDTKLRCACGFEAATKREMTLHLEGRTPFVLGMENAIFLGDEDEACDDFLGVAEEDR